MREVRGVNESMERATRDGDDDRREERVRPEKPPARKAQCTARFLRDGADILTGGDGNDIVYAGADGDRVKAVLERM